MLSEALAGRSRAVVLRGEPGIGKTALLRHVMGRLDGWHVATAAGIESEKELAFSGLHQLCAGMLDRLDRLPGPQREALATAFGRSAGPPPDRFLLGLGVVTLFADVAEQQPLACIVDDAQWLDRASAQIIAFVARRLQAERIVMICAVRTDAGDDSLSDVPEMAITGLPKYAARALLLESVHGPLDSAVREQIVAESRGNPLALLELPRTWGLSGLPGGFAVPVGGSVAGRVEQSYARRLQDLPADARLLVVTAAADPTGDPALLYRAAEELGVDTAALGSAVDAGLLRLEERIIFVHPLVRSAAYTSASPDERRNAHRALAASTDAEKDPDRRAWHRAGATQVVDEEIAAELERSAARARARGGPAAAAAFLARATELTSDPAMWVRRALDAAAASVEAGAFGAARSLLSTVEFEAQDDASRARGDLLRARIAMASSRGKAAVPLLVGAARRLESVDSRMSRETYLDAFGAAHFASRLNAEIGVADVASAARSAPSPDGPPAPADLLLDAYIALEADYATAVPVCKRALAALRDGTVPAEQLLRLSWYGVVLALEIWDDESTQALSVAYLEQARRAGALSELARALTSCPTIVVLAGDFDRAAELDGELKSLQEVTGIETARYVAMMLLAWRGQEREAEVLIDATIRDAGSRGEGMAVGFSGYSRALLCNALGRSGDAAAAAGLAVEHRELVSENWGLTELTEAATRTGATERARDALGRLSVKAQAAGTPWALGLSARARALLAGADAEMFFEEAVDLLRLTRIRTELARTHLLYGEWLRQRGRRLEARKQLGEAYEQCCDIGMAAFADRARREMAATGATVRQPDVDTFDALTEQEAQIMRLARQGLSNGQIGAQLFLSPRTVEWHLSHVFAKLGVRGRRELAEWSRGTAAT